MALIVAAILAGLALTALLLSLRLAAIALIATGMSLLAGTVTLYLLGYTFNALVTLGLLLAFAVVPVEQPAIDVEVNVLKARLVGLTPGTVRREAGTLLSGLTVGNFFQEQKVFDVVVWGAPAVRGNLTSIDNLLIDTPSGGQVRLGDVATVTVSQQPQDIRHDATSVILDVTAQVFGRSVASADSAIASALHTIAFPLEYHTELPAAASGGTSRPAFVELPARRTARHRAAGPGRVPQLAAGLAGAGSGGAAARRGGRHGPGDRRGLAGCGGRADRRAGDRPAPGDRAGGPDPLRPRRRRRRADPRPAPATAAGEGAGPVITGAVMTAVMLVPFIVMGDVAGNELAHGRGRDPRGPGHRDAGDARLPVAYLRRGQGGQMAETRSKRKSGEPGRPRQHPARI